MVGGEINYRCLGNGQYELMVTVFRDCDTGVPWFDNPASIGVFDNNDSLIYDLRLRLRNNDTLDLQLTDPCLVAPPNVCIHTTTYLDTVSLPYYPGGYQIVYQRCCRNQDIVNIVNPTSTGATYSSFISEQALLNCNSSARFKEWPPVYVCQGVPLNYDHSAIDVDNDSIVYELCTPFTGATAGQSMPQPPNNPPYNSVNWLSPYSVDNMLGGPDSLKINPQTGLLTGTPNTIGVFVVGVCAKEYRNGILISTTRRDFQYVVGVCGRLVAAAFFAPEVQCDNSLIVNFQNNSNSLGTGYSWSFGDSTTNATSNVASPSYIYPDTGTYEITLIADPGTLCSDTLVQQINLQYESIITDFDITSANCTDSLFLDVTDLTIDTISSIVRWSWDFGNGQTSNLPYPTTVYDTSGTYVIRLRVFAANGCIATQTDTLVLSLPTLSSDDTLAICAGDTSIFLNPTGDPSHQYLWSPAIGLSSPTAANPLATIQGSQTYQVTITVPNGIDTCILERTITVVQSPPITIDIEPIIVTCLDSVAVVANAVGATQVQWSTDPTFNLIYTTGDSVKLLGGSTQTWYARATNRYGCEAIDTFIIFANNTPINVNWGYNVTQCDTLYQVQFIDLTQDTTSGNIVAWRWDFGDGQSSTLQNPIHAFAQSGNYTIKLEVVSSGGCVGSLTQNISFNLPTRTGADTVGICQGQNSVFLNQNPNTNVQYLWSPAASLNSATVPNPLASPSVPTTYTVTITAVNNGDTCRYIDRVHVNFPPPVVVTTPPTLNYCGDSVTLVASSPTGVQFDWSGDNSFNIIVATGNPIRVLPLTTPLGLYYVRAIDAYGCADTTLAFIEQNPPVITEFSFQPLGCSDTIAIQFTDLTSDTATSPIVSWQWTTASGQSSTLQNPILTFDQSQTDTVTLTVTLANGCVGTKTQVININLATTTSSRTLIVCAGQTTVVLNPQGNPSLTYDWSPASGVNNPKAVSPIASIVNPPLDYVVTITGSTLGTTCRTIDTITIEQAAPISIAVPKDTITCANVFNVVAIVSNNVTTEWSFNSNFTPVALYNINSFFLGLPNPPATSQMFIRATDQYGCQKIDTTRILRRNIPIPVDFVTDVLSCGDTLEVQFTNTTAYPSSLPNPPTWQWNVGTGQTFNYQDITHRYTGVGPFAVTLTATSPNGCVGQKTDTLDYQLPTFDTPNDIGLCGLDSVQLNVGGNPTLLYQWQPSAGLSNANVASPWANPLVTTAYQVTISSINGADTCEIVETVTVDVDDFVFEAMPDTVVCSNRISLQASNIPVAQVVWALDRQFKTIIGQTNPLVTNINDSRWFYVYGRSAGGCEAIDSVLVQYHRSDFELDFELDRLSCEDSLLLAIQNLTQDSLIQNWQWDFGNGQSSTLQNPAPITYNNATSYTIKLSAAVNAFCRDSVSKIINLELPSLAVATPLISTCGQDSVALQLVNSNPNWHYQWSPATGLSDPTAANPMAMPTTDITYQVQVLAISNLGGVADTCILTDSILVTKRPSPLVQIVGDTIGCDTLIRLQANSSTATNISWSLERDFQNTISNAALLNTSQNQVLETYYVAVTDSFGCRAVDSTEVTWAVVDIDLSPVYYSCRNELLRIGVTSNTNAAALNYDWQPSAWIQAGQGTDSVTIVNNSSGNLQVIATNSIGCTDTATTTWAIAPLLTVAALGDSIWCTNSIDLTAIANQIVTFDWSMTNNFANIIGQQSLLQTNLTNNNQLYYVQATDTFGCQAIDSIAVQYRGANVLIDSVSMICQNNSTVLVANNLNLSDTLIYNWQADPSIVAGQNSDSLEVSPTTTTNYTLYVENQYGCSDTAQGQVMVASSLPTLQITASQDTIVLGDTAQLFATQRNDYIYNWSPDNTLFGTNIYAPIVQPIANNNYYLTITDGFGCQATDSITIYIQPSTCAAPYIFVPNAFTPDGDGQNDIIVPEGSIMTEIYFAIYNRWGELVFETNQLGKGWDGTYKGELLPSDVFGYYIKARCLDGNQFFNKGNITLIR